MEEQNYLDNISDLSAEQIVEGITNGVVTFEELRKTGEFDASIQKNVRVILKQKDDAVFAVANTLAALENYITVFPNGQNVEEAKRKIDDTTFALANTLADLENYIEVFPNGQHVEEAKRKIQEILDKEIRETDEALEREKMLRNIRQNINEYTPDEVLGKLSSDDFENLCNELDIDASLIRNYSTPELRPNDFPQSANEIPEGYTDVFFWGIPSSGKTCALAAILSTIKKNYSMEAPDIEIQFGATYRDSLVQIFRRETGFLPARTNTDMTQYMPFMFYKRGESNKQRRVSFFELSGEVFEEFYDIINNTNVIKENKKENIRKSFKALELLLNSNNQKIHFFFIDYNAETRHKSDSNGLSQSNYLEAAATYFSNNNNIFRKKTDAVYVIVTKSDEIKSENKIDSATEFLNEYFGSFIDVLKNQCERNSVEFKIKIFSIGDVYFKQICKINRNFSEDIINDLLVRIPGKESWWRKFFNS